MTKYEEEKLINGSYKIEWEFNEYIQPNVVQKTFKQFGKKPKAKKTKTTKKKTAKYITELLTKCKTMKKVKRDRHTLLSKIKIYYGLYQ